MCKHGVKKLLFVIRHVLGRYKTQKICDKSILENGRMLESVPGQYNTQEICESVASEDTFLLKYCHDRYNTQEMCNKVVGDVLSTLKFLPVGLLQVKRLKNFILFYTQMMIYSF